MIEIEILKIIHSFSNPVLDVISLVLSNSLYFFVLLTLVLFIKRKKQFFLYLSGFLLTLGITQVIKWIIQRPRPYLVIEGIGKASSLSSSFPSLHASLAFFTAVFLSRYYKKYTPLLLAFAVLISLSRIFLMVHYLTDILVGALLGFIIGYIFVNKEKVILKCTKRFCLK